MKQNSFAENTVYTSQDQQYFHKKVMESLSSVSPMSDEIIEFLWLLSAFINAEALKDQRGLDLPAWKKELFGVTDDAHEEAIFVKTLRTIRGNGEKPQVKELGFFR